MGYLRWGLALVFWGGVAAFFHYTLPQYDVVRIVNTYEERQELNDWTRVFWSSPDAQTQNLTSRDVQFIQAVRPDGDAIVYRNEDTGWSWPPYFKFDTANLYTEANDAISSKDTPEWVAIRHYGWRNQFLSIFPNAVSLKPVEGPDAKITNWRSIVILIGLAAVFWAIYVRWRRFKARRVDPLVDDVEDNFYAVGDAVAERKNKLMQLFKKK
ncbi:DUF1523 family protein [Epibacterium ulvae]|uniref:DUF1523 family protein n=1 Tax=Epibacterium ulvae TaxID=1156985 RepID=UPI001BFCA2EC|nr:DUF1523 family protein [Epibacterium ulvae]MBT8153819.1 DUF1523 family protein [Epibacterium ulvae]